jgi:hypothetical protein
MTQRPQMKGHLYQPLAKKPPSAFRQKPLNDLQDQSSRRFMPSLWDGCGPNHTKPHFSAQDLDGLGCIPV